MTTGQSPFSLTATEFNRDFTCHSLRGPSRTEAEHPQPRFGKVKMTEGGPQPLLPAPAGTTTTEAAATKSTATTEPATTAAEILESALSFLG